MRKPRASLWECFAKKGPSPVRAKSTPGNSRPKSSARKPPFYGAPTGLVNVLRPKPKAMPRAFTLRPVGAGKAWLVAGPFPVGVGKAWFVARTLGGGRCQGFRELAWGTAEGRAAATEVPAWGFAGFLLGFGREIGSGPLAGGIGVGGAPALHDLDLGFFALLFIANG